MSANHAIPRRGGRWLAMTVFFWAVALVMLGAGAGKAGAWDFSEVDHGSTEAVGLALDEAGNAHVVYGMINTTTARFELRYAHNTGGSWQIQAVADLDYTIAYPHVAVDFSGVVHIVYCVGDDLVYLRGHEGGWSSTTVDRVQYALGYGSLGVDSQGAAHVCYVDPYGSLKYATNASGAWQNSYLEGTGAIGQVVTDTSLVVDRDDKVHISYLNIGKLMYTQNRGGSWSKIQVAADGFQTRTTSLALDEQGNAHITYARNRFDLGYATNRSGTWQVESVEAVGILGGNSALVLDTAGNPHVLYTVHDSGAHVTQMFSLRYAAKSGQDWMRETAYDQGNTYYPTAVVNPQNVLHALFYAGGSGLLYATRSLP